MRKFLKSFFSVAVTLYFSATMFYCFVAGAPAGGNGKVIYLVSAAGLAVLMPFIIGALIAYILNPAVARFYKLFRDKCKIKSDALCKILAIITAYVLVIGIIVIVLFGVIPQIITSLTDLVNFIPTAAQQLYHFFDTLEERFPSLDTEVLRNTINNAIPNFINYAKDFAANMIPALYSISMSILKWVLNLFIAIMVSIYMLADKRPLVNSCKAVVYAFVPVKYIQLILEVSAEANRLFSSFIVGKAIDSTIIGVLCFVLMLILRLPYAVLISVIVGITNMIPYFGPFIGAIPSTIILLFISPLKAVIFVVMVFVLQQFDGLILGPKILGNATGLSSFWVMFAILLFGGVMGFAGMVVGVPLFAVLYSMLTEKINHLLKKRGLSVDTNDYRGHKRIDPETHAFVEAQETMPPVSAKERRRAAQQKNQENKNQ